MEYLYRMSNQQLAKRILSYINRTEALQKQVSDILDKHIVFNKELLMDEYRDLKNALRRDSREVQRKEFDRPVRTNEVKNNFYWSVMEAAAEGLISRVGSRIDFEFFSYIAEAHYKLTKYYSKEEWEALAEG